MERLLLLFLVLLLHHINTFKYISPLFTVTTRFDQRLSLQKLESVVSSENEKLRLDSYLSSVFKGHSRSFYASMIEKGLVQVNKKSVDKSYKVQTGDRIDATLEEKQETTIEAENIPLDIIHEDDHILAINKPKGMVVHPAPGSPNGTFVNALLYHLGEKATGLLNTSSIAVDEDEDIDLPETPEAATSSPVFLRPGIVHRLDKGTTGVLLAGKYPAAVEQLSKLFAARKVTKTYLAICVGHPGDTTINERIGRSLRNRQIMCVSPDGREAITHTRVIGFDGKLSVVLIRIETGRTHQIRVHLQHRRTPILGDDVYGNVQWNKLYQRTHKDLDRPLLHAYETAFPHPFPAEMKTTGKKKLLKSAKTKPTETIVRLRAPLPPDMESILMMVQRKMKLSPSQRLYDETTKLLVVSTDVAGARSTEPQLLHGGGTPVHSMEKRQQRKYVPLDRLRMRDGDSDEDNFIETLPDDYPFDEDEDYE